MKRGFIDPGALNHSFVLERVVETSDGCGGTEISFEPVATIWGSLVPKRAGNTLVAQQQTEEILHDITIRFRSDVASGWRLRLQDRLFAVETLHDPDERKRYLICSTKEEGR